LCMASAHFYPTRGGATQRFLNYLPGLQKRGFEIRLITGTPKSKKAATLDNEVNGHNLPIGDFLLTEKPEKIQAHRVLLPDRAGWRRSMVFSQALLNFCREPGYRPDVVQVISSFQPRSIPWIMRLRRLGIRLVYAYTIPLATPSNLFKRAIRHWAFRMLFANLDCLVVGSKMMRDLLLPLCPRTRIEVIPNGVDLVRFGPALTNQERNDIRTSLNLCAGDKMVTTVGAVHPRKGSDLLLKAWVPLSKRFPQAHLFMIGLRKDVSYPELSEFKDKIESLVSAASAPDRIHFPGRVSNVADYLKASDVFAFPSAREGMPNVVLEAMASGLPVILTPFIGLSDDFGQPGQHYLLVERNPESLAVAMTEFLENREMSQNLGDRARALMVETMDLEKVLDRYASLYRELVEEI
jgi:glycosyltransferase involved in cell wall biosynthesis